jgi:uridine kinase
MVGVSGRSCSGKGVATETLAGNNYSVLLLQSDYYFYNNTPCTYNGYQCWEHINCIDFDRLIRDVDSLKKGEGISIVTPSWMSQTKVSISSQDLSKKNLIIVDGFLTFAVKKLVELLDYKIFVDASDYNILSRRPMRDGFGVFNYVRDVVIPVSKEYESIQKEKVDLIVDGDKSKAEVVEKVSRFLQEKLSKSGFTIGQSPWKVHPGDLVQDSVWHPIDFGDLKEWVKNMKSRLDNGVELKGHTFRYRKNLRSVSYEVRMSSQCKPRIRRYTLEPT